LALSSTACNSGGESDRAAPDPPTPPTVTQRTGKPPAEDTTSLARACDFLWKKQADDGGWHSETYGLLKTGQALTPFVLHALLEVPESIYARPPQGVERALDFIRSQANAEGALGFADPEISEYPNYATAYALRCLLKASDGGDAELIRRMRDYLIAEQFNEDRGFSLDMPAYGGWGFGGEQPPGKTGHMDLAHTRRILEAIAEAGADPAIFERAERFLAYVQRDPADDRPQPGQPAEASEKSKSTFDGGFYFSPIVLAANKAQQETTPAGDYYRSYATTTCDGALALLAAGAPRDDDRTQAALAWLKRNADLHTPAGIPPDHPEPWGEALFHYHLAARAEVYALVGWPQGDRRRLVEILAEHQREDGSFQNEMSTLQKEDDPLLATTMAVIALSRASRTAAEANW
jgi:hypothetical protein